MDGTKKLVEWRFREPIFDYLKWNLWLFTEKVDGTNTRIHWDWHRFSYGGRTDSAVMQPNVVEALDKIFQSKEVEQIFEQKFGETEVTLFGEWYWYKVQSATFYTNHNETKFVLFDVNINWVYLSRKDAEDIATAIWVEIVPIIFEWTLQQAVDFIKTKPDSKFAKWIWPMEWLVWFPEVRCCTHMGKRVIVKIVAKDFA